jgi:DNA (cytosine-5)-methyltransferase 1
MGYHLAGFEVTGVDLLPQPRYPFTFVQGDAIEYVRAHGHEFDAIHASPPCHDHSSLASRVGADGTGWLLQATREALIESNLPYVIENVEGAPLLGAVWLCGTEFGLSAVCRDGKRRWLKRHRGFESNMLLMGAGGCHCFSRPTGGVYGNGGGGQQTRGYKFHIGDGRVAMGIDWMVQAELSQAIPPAMTRFIGEQLLSQIRIEVSR